MPCKIMTEKKGKGGMYNQNDLHVRVVTYMSRVEAFATGIKVESSDQSSFWWLIKGSRWPPIC